MSNPNNSTKIYNLQNEFTTEFSVITSVIIEMSTLIGRGLRYI